MEEIHSAIAKKELPLQDRARILSASNEHASIWLTKLPTEPHFQLSGTDLAIAIRHRIGLAPTDHEGVACMGCNKSITDSNHDHYHVCRRLVSATIARHNTILSAVQTIATTAGSQVQREYRTAAIDYKKKFRIGSNKKPVDLHRLVYSLDSCFSSRKVSSTYDRMHPSVVSIITSSLTYRSPHRLHYRTSSGRILQHDYLPPNVVKQSNAKSTAKSQLWNMRISTEL